MRSTALVLGISRCTTGASSAGVLAGGALALGESYVDGWWDCPALDEMCARAIGARLDQRFARNFGKFLALPDRNLQVFQILFAKEKAIEGNLRPMEIPAAYSSAGRLPNESIPVR